jgi:hypothetical protein
VFGLKGARETIGKRSIHEQTTTMTAKVRADPAGVGVDGSQRKLWLNIATGHGMARVVLGHVTNDLVAAKFVVRTAAAPSPPSIACAPWSGRTFWVPELCPAEVAARLL